MDPITGGHDAPASTSTLVTGLAALGTMVCVGIFVLLATVFTAWAEKVGLVDWLVRCCTGHVDPLPDDFDPVRGRQQAPPPPLPPVRDLAIAALAGRSDRGATRAAAIARATQQQDAPSLDEDINTMDIYAPDYFDDNRDSVLEAHVAATALTVVGALAMARAARRADAARTPAAPPPPAEADLEA